MGCWAAGLISVLGSGLLSALGAVAFTAKICSMELIWFFWVM